MWNSRNRPRPWRARDVLTSEDANGQAVLLYLPTGTYLRLDGSAAGIVELLNHHSDPQIAASQLAKKFDIPIERARRDVDWVIASIGAQSARRRNKGRRPTLTGTRAVISGWRRQKWSVRLLIMKVSFVVAGVEVGLKLFNVATLATRMGVPLALDGVRSQSPLEDGLADLPEDDQRTYAALTWVMNRWLYDGTCLRRALTFGWFLRHRKPVLRLGMTADSDVVAHAWIEVDGISIDAQSVTTGFASHALKNVHSKSDGED